MVYWRKRSEITLTASIFLEVVVLHALFGRLFTLLPCCWLLIESKVHQNTIASRFRADFLKSLRGASLYHFFAYLSLSLSLCEITFALVDRALRNGSCQSGLQNWANVNSINCFLFPARGTFFAHPTVITRQCCSCDVRRRRPNFIARKLWFAPFLEVRARAVDFNGSVLVAAAATSLIYRFWQVPVLHFEFCDWLVNLAELKLSFLGRPCIMNETITI